MPTYTVPGVRFEIVDADRATIDPARVDVCAFVGVAERGPVDTAVRLTSWEQFTSTFGLFRPVGMLPYAVKAFFENGGRACVVVRVCAPEASLQLAAVAQPGDRLSSVLADVSDVVLGAVVTFQQGPVVHNYLVAEVDPATNTVTWDRELDAGYDLASPPATPLELATGGGAASTTIADDAGNPCLDVSAIGPGSWGSRLSVVVGPSPGAAFRTTAATQPASRLVSYVTSTAGLEPGAVVRATQGGAGPTVVTRVLVDSVNAADGAIGWASPLDPSYLLTEPIGFELEAFSLAVRLDGVTREAHQGLSLRAEHPRFAPRVVAADSTWIRAELAAAALPPLAVAASGPEARLLGGRDGTAGLRTNDVLGDPSAPVRTGLRVLELVPEPALVAVPDLVAEPVPAAARLVEPPPEHDPCCPVPWGVPEAPAAIDPVLTEAWHGFADSDVLAAQERIVTVCETSERVALLDPKRCRTAGGAPDLAGLLDWRSRFDSSYAALFAPWVDVLDPLGGVGADPLRPIPPSGHVAGIAGRVDAERGPSEAPANQRLRWAQELDCTIEAAEQGVLDPAGISCLRPISGRGLRVYGSRTLSLDGNLRYLNVRRQLLAIRRTLGSELQWAAFEPIDATLANLVTLSVTGYLTELWRAGGLAGATPEEAFLVRADDEANASEQAALGEFHVDVLVAVVVPAHYVIVRIGRTADTLSLEEVA